MNDIPPLPADLLPAPLDADELVAEIDREYEDAEAADRPYRITDDGAAEWAGRKLAAATARLAGIGDRAEEWHAQIDHWARTESAAPQREAAFFEGLLIDYARRRREADPKAKTLRLPSVTVSSRGTDKPRAVVTDDETVCNWLRGLGLDAYYSVKYSPLRRELGDAIEVKLVPGMSDGERSDPDYYVALLDGEEVPGVEIQEPTVSFTVKPNGGAA